MSQAYESDFLWAFFTKILVCFDQFFDPVKRVFGTIVKNQNLT